MGAQRPLVEAIIATGKPVVLVFQSGKPVTEPGLVASSSAVLQQFYAGETGGAALADIIFGIENPSGMYTPCLSSTPITPSPIHHK